MMLESRAGGASPPPLDPVGRAAGRAGEAGRRAPPSSGRGLSALPRPAGARPPAVLRPAAPRCLAGGVPARPAAFPRGRARVRLVRFGEIFLPTPCRVSPPPSLLRLLLPEPCPQGVSGDQVGAVPGPRAGPRAGPGGEGADQGGPGRCRRAGGRGPREPCRPQPGLKLWHRIPGL
ncbi:hypothetical protein J1605_022084 [Eschrichtius robustus]|uniref:Uncharacterized protein n=1 Tax=Eschrichtius robustus TaxID=9764 RepID=A0AB34H9T2_ESCRO|nr:hypothetical protein J1605_022084 [Eschrichtius robustus]